MLTGTIKRTRRKWKSLEPPNERIWRIILLFMILARMFWLGTGLTNWITDSLIFLPFIFIDYWYSSKIKTSVWYEKPALIRFLALIGIEFLWIVTVIIDFFRKWNYWTKV